LDVEGIAMDICQAWLQVAAGAKRPGFGVVSRVRHALEEAHFSDAKKALPSTVVSRAGE
jgi:hypothetical protein